MNHSANEFSGYDETTVYPQTFRPTVYIGPSMNPTLKAPDILEITSYTDVAQIKVGDVIVFDSPREKKSITHRVIKAGPKGILTRGDNNCRVDPWQLKFENITGRVDWAKRGQRRLRIWGGNAGRLFEKYVRTRSLVLRACRKILRPLYHWLAKSQILHKLMPKKLALKVIGFNCGEQKELHLHFGSLFVGRKLPGKNWQVRFPFRLFIDPARLPKK